MPPTPGPLTHVALTVSDLQRSAAWYTQLFGVAPFHTGTFLADTEHEYEAAIWATPSLGLHCFVGKVDGEFNARRPGLDHIAIGCIDRASLDEWVVHLDALGVQHDGVLDETYGAGLAVRDPDGIALEFFTSHRPVAAG